jgi:hypothetical protein
VAMQRTEFQLRNKTKESEMVDDLFQMNTS